MTQGKVKAVIFIIIGILIVAIICSWLAGKDNDANKLKPTALTNTVEIQNQEPDTVAATPAPGSNAPTIGSSYTSGTNNAGGTNNTNHANNNAAVNNNNTNNTNNANNTNNTNNTANTANNTANNNPTTTTTTGDVTIGDAPAVTPEPTPAVTPEPTPEPTPSTMGTTNAVEGDTSTDFVARKLTNATFENSRGMLNLRADVNVETYSEKEVLVVVDLSLDSYSIFLYGNPEGAGVAVNGVFTKVATPDVNIPGNARSTVSLGKAAFAIELTDGSQLTIPVAVEWYFNGTYAGEAIDKIECGGSVTINRN